MSKTTDEAAKHYDIGGIQTWDFIIAKELTWLEGCAVAYIVRARHKGSRVEDLRKARDFINKMLEGAADESKGGLDSRYPDVGGGRLDFSTQHRVLASDLPITDTST